jgi:tetratricopeptide (TPR) repeat protein
MTKAKAPSFTPEIDPLPSRIHKQMVTAQQLEVAFLRELNESLGTSKDALWKLAWLYSETGRHDKASAFISRLARLSANREEAASCLLAQGQLSEQGQDYESAVRHYRAALALEQRQAPTWYWIHNNLGYSLVRLGRCHEATTYLQVALAVDPTRSNAFKNMGLAMLGLNENAKAAEWFVTATRVKPADRRSLKHLEQLVEEHPELLTQVSTLQGDLDACRRLNPLA